MSEELKGQGFPIFIFKLYSTLQLHLRLLFSNEHQAFVFNITGVGEMTKEIENFSYRRYFVYLKIYYAVIQKMPQKSLYITQ